jgi:undecaprenyl-diphosphatase
VKFILFGILQGLTEFLPISSSGHLYILKKIVKLNQNLLPFFVLLHLATFFAIILYFRKEIPSFFSKKIITHIFIITAISGAVAFIIKYLFIHAFDYKLFISFCFFINAIVLLRIKEGSQRKRNIDDINIKDSIILGILQGIAVLPGISRSGITISTLLERRFTEKETFKFSFIMGLPIILIAFLAEINELTKIKILPFHMSLGFLSAFLGGIIALGMVKKTVIKEKFRNFGYYSLLISLLTLLLL